MNLFFSVSKLFSYLKLLVWLLKKKRKKDGRKNETVRNYGFERFS